MLLFDESQIRMLKYRKLQKNSPIGLNYFDCIYFYINLEALTKNLLIMKASKFSMKRSRMCTGPLFLFCAFCVYFVMGTMFVSCSDDSESRLILREGTETRNGEDPGLEMTPELVRLAHLAGEELNKSQSETADCKVTCIMSEVKSRGTDADTLGYVFNYPKSGGFVILDNAKQYNQILAYSPDNNFPMDDDNPVSKYIISSIKSYLEEKQWDKLRSSEAVVKIDGKLVHHSVEPIVKTQLDQNHPFNQFVRMYEGAAYAGCVPVAAVSIICYTEKQLVFNNYKYYFPDVVKYLLLGPRFPSAANGIVPQDPYLLSFPKTYDGSVMAVSRLLYDLGKAMGVEYTDDSTFGDGLKALYVMKQIGCTTTSQTFPFNERDVLNYLEENNLIFTEGQPYEGKDGHAWVIDGCSYYTYGIANEIYKSYFHCDWGWGGSFNGYYTGEIFSPSSGHSYRLYRYFPVKIKE